MADSIRERILANVKTALDGVASGITTVARNRTDDIGITEMPAAILLDGGHTADEVFSGQAGMTLEFSVECFVTGATDDARTAAVDALYVLVTQALLADLSRCGLASDTREAAMSEPIESEEDEKRSAAFSLDFEVDYETSETDPTVS